MMPVFYCKVVDENGETAEFTRETESEELLVRELTTNKFLPIAIRETKLYGKRGPERKRLKNAIVIEFTDTFHLLLSSGLTLRDALEVAQTIFTNGKLNQIATSILASVKKGASFHEALSRLGESFPPMYNGMVRVGEKIGSLEAALKGLSRYMSEKQKLKEKFIGSMIYPFIVMGVAFVGIVILVTFILPRIKVIFSQLGAQLPERIESLAGVMNALTAVGAAAAGLCVVCLLFYLVIRHREGTLSRFVDRALLKTPILGGIRFLRENLNFLFAMETLTNGGFTVEEALLESGSVVSSSAIRQSIVEAREKILKGEALSSAFSKGSIFPEKMIRWINIGEKSGRIERAFGQLRAYYQREAEKWSSRFMTLIEPILILFLGLTIFLFIILFIVPIFSMYGSL
jgi:type II secretory pathway component PulF